MLVIHRISWAVFGFAIQPNKNPHLHKQTNQTSHSSKQTKKWNKSSMAFVHPKKSSQHFPWVHPTQPSTAVLQLIWSGGYLAYCLENITAWKHDLVSGLWPEFHKISKIFPSHLAVRRENLWKPFWFDSSSWACQASSSRGGAPPPIGLPIRIWENMNPKNCKNKFWISRFRCVSWSYFTNLD